MHITRLDVCLDVWTVVSWDASTLDFELLDSEILNSGTVICNFMWKFIYNFTFLVFNLKLAVNFSLYKHQSHWGAELWKYLMLKGCMKVRDCFQKTFIRAFKKHSFTFIPRFNVKWTIKLAAGWKWAEFLHYICM